MQGSESVLLLAQIIGKLLVAILSFILIVPMWMHLNAFNGHCALYSEAFSNSTASPYPTSVSWSNGSACDYTILLGITALSISVMCVVTLSVRLYQHLESTILATFVSTVVNILFAIFTFAGALCITSGFAAWCKSLEDASKFQDKCRVISYGFNIPGVIDNGASFYIDLSIAKFGAWLSFAVWTVNAAMTGGKLCILHRTEPIPVALKQEWKRWIPSFSGQDANYKRVAEE